MKAPKTLEDVKAYAFGFAAITVLSLAPFAIMAVFSYLISLF